VEYVLTQPRAMAAAAADVAGVGSAINEANATAAGSTTGVPAAAADEVSAAAATLLSAYAREYQALTKQAAAFHSEFTRVLAAARSAYAETEAAASGALRALAAPAQALVAPLTGGAAGVAAAKAVFADPLSTPVALSLIMTGTGTPTPPLHYMNEVYRLYISPNFTANNVQGLTTPEQLYPLTGVKSLPLDQSLSEGVTILNNAIMQAYSNGITPVNVFGYSQSAVIASLEMPNLVVAGVPSTAINFVLIGDPMNPNGGVFARFPGLTVPSLGATFYGATPANDYPTVIYTGEYDGYADFPQYPIDFLSDLNALFGVISVHGAYPTFTAAQVMSATTLPTSGPTMTTYYMIPTQNLPLLDPVRAIPYVGNPVADLLQPDLTYLVNWGYGNPAYGYSAGSANVATPFGFLPPLGATTALGPDLVSGTQQGIAAAVSAFHAEGLPSLPSPSLSGISHAFTSALSAVPSTLALPTATSVASTIDGIITGLEAANTNIADGLWSALSTAYATLLPTADIVTAGLTTLPAYDLNLFLNGISQALNREPVQGLINAIGYPIAADTALVMLGGLVEGYVLLNAALRLSPISGASDQGDPVIAASNGRSVVFGCLLTASRDCRCQR